MRDLPKLAWSRDVTEKVDNIYSNLTRFTPPLKSFVMSQNFETQGCQSWHGVKRLNGIFANKKVYKFHLQ